MYTPTVTQLDSGEFKLIITGYHGKIEYTAVYGSVDRCNEDIIKFTYGRLGKRPKYKPAPGEPIYNSSFYMDEVGQYVAFV